MNVYEQLEGIREELQERDVKPATLQVINRMLARAESQRNSALSMTKLQVLRHVMSTPDVLNNEDVRLDFLGLQGDLEEEAEKRAQTPVNAYDDDERKPKLKKFYKDKKR